MYSLTRSLLWLVAISFLLTACGLASATTPVATSVSEKSPVPTVRAIASATVTATVTETLTPQPPTATPSPTATATPLPLAIVAAAPGWTATIREAIPPAESSGWRWEILSVVDPAGALAAGQAHLALAAGEEGIPAGQQPLVLAVPFTAAWENTTLDRALEIVEQGDALVTVIPWHELTPDLKPLRVEGLHPLDSGYPLQTPQALRAAPGFEAAATALAPLLAATGPPHAVRLAAVGDVMLDRQLGGAISAGNIDFPFEPVAALLRAADVTVGNLESALGDTGEPAEKSYTFRAPPEASRALAGAGFDVLSLANNHALDYGPSTLLQGIELLQAVNVATVGAGADVEAAHTPTLIDAGGLTLAFLGYVHVPVEGRAPYFDTESWTASESTPGVAWAVPEQIRADVARAKLLADHVIVLLHSGYEYNVAPSEPQRAAAQAAIEAGAELVVGHHAHVLQGIEFYEEGVIVYGLGNFAFTVDGPPETAILQAWLDEEGLRHLELIPAVVQANGQPRLAEGELAAAIRAEVYRMTNILNPRSN